MKRSKTVTLALVPLFAALALPGCSKPVCVDKTGTVVDQKRCEDEEQRQASQPGVTPFYYDSLPDIRNWIAIRQPK